MPLSSNEKKTAKEFFLNLQKSYSKVLEKIDGTTTFKEKSWTRTGGGGGKMLTLRGKVIEKAGVNVSEVFGDNYPQMEEKYS